ncbi:MAG TPA: response regulator [Longimicrobium sp.]
MPGRTVLLIDDDEDVARIMGEVLTHAGYEMVHAGSLADAKRLLEIADPGVVLVEPYALGRGRWAEVAALAARRPVPCVALTTLAAEEEPARSAGCARFLAKPVSPRRVLEAIDALVPRRDARPGAARAGQEPAASGKRHRG